MSGSARTRVPVTKGGGFRRQPRLCLDVRVERRLTPVYEVRRDQLEWNPKPKHWVSCQPREAVRPYVDPGQKACPAPAHEVIAKTAIKLYESGKFLEKEFQADGSPSKEDKFVMWTKVRRAGWRPHERAREKEEEYDELLPEERLALMDDWTLEQERKREKAEQLIKAQDAEKAAVMRDLGGVCRSGLAGVMRRGKSLPTLGMVHTRFGKTTGPNGRTFQAALRPEWVDNMQFKGDTSAEYLAQSMMAKPALHLVTQQGHAQKRPATSPEATQLAQQGASQKRPSTAP